jgi:tetratricopeptide (TPR) repeat protein
MPLVTLTTGSQTAIRALAFSPDGARLAWIRVGSPLVQLWIARESDAEREQRRWVWREQQADAAEARRQWFVAAFHLGLLIERAPDSAVLYRRRGDTRAEQGHWQEALADFTAAAAKKPRQPWHSYRRGMALLAADKEPAYRTLCGQLLRDFGNSKEAEAAAAVAALAVLRPEAVADVAALVRLAEAGAGKDRPATASAGETLGAALYRAGRHEEAAKRLGELAKVSVEGQFFLAMAYHQLGAADKARQCLAGAVKRMGEGVTAGTKAALPPSWPERVRWRLLRAEAESLLSAATK